MRIIVFFLFLFPCLVSGQDEKSAIIVDFYDVQTRTKGLLIQMDSLDAQLYASSVVGQSNVKLFSAGRTIFEEEKQFVFVKKANKYTFSYFIPYRSIELKEGQYENIDLTCSINNKVQLSTKISFKQPRRYTIDIQLKSATVKQKLLPYDEVKNPKDWAPDPYFEFTVNGSKQPVFKNSHQWNSYEINPQRIYFHILQGDTLHWNFYDKDGIQKEWLGSYTDFQTTGDFEDKVYEKMFGQIKGLTFDLKQTELLIQPINIYYKGLTTLHGRAGSLWQIKYDVSKAQVGKSVLPTLEVYDENEQRLDLVYYEAANERTPSVGIAFDLAQKGVLDYFIPFYAWENQTEILKFKFQSTEKQDLEAAPYFLPQKIEFESLVKYADVEVQENYEYQEVQGVLLTLQYHIGGLSIPLDLNLTLGVEIGKSILLMDKEDIVITKYPYKIKQAKEKEQLKIFVPYSQIPTPKLQVLLSLVLDYNLGLINEEMILNRYAEKDIQLELITARSAFLKDNYGYQFEIKAKVPQLFRRQGCQLEINLTKEGSLFNEYRFSGNLDKINNNLFSIKGDSVVATVLVPSRLLKSKEKIALNAVIKDKANKLLSAVVQSEWEAPQELWNKNMTVSLQRFVLEKMTRKDTTISWQYIIKAGDEEVFSVQLPIKLGNKNREEYKATIFANREDNLSICIQNNKSKKQYEIWKGDWSKLANQDYKVELEKQHAIRKLKINFSEN